MRPKEINTLFPTSFRVRNKMSDLFHSSVRMQVPLHFKCMQWEIRRYTFNYFRNSEISCSGSGSRLTPASYPICNCKKKPLIMTSVARPEEQRCQLRGKFFLILPMIRLFPEARVLITLNLVCITSNGPNGNKII